VKPKKADLGPIKDDDLKLVKVRGELVWHQHDDTDEWFRAGCW
jgi:hypothetical protein